MDRLGSNFGTYTIYMLLWLILLYSNPKSFVNFLLPNRGSGVGWGGVKNLRLLQGLLYNAIHTEFFFARRHARKKFYSLNCQVFYWYLMATVVAIATISCK